MNPDPQSVPLDPFADRFRYGNGSRPLEGFTIRRGIGAGGFGEVYFAVSDAGKEVALKRILRNLDVELRGVQNCLNLKHVNLISLWDIRTTPGGESWVVMEYVPGPSLRDIIEVSDHGMPDHQIERWFESIAAAVGYLHQQGIVHRDLKPANIFLDEDEDIIKIGDYGLSKYISGSQGGGQTETVGTFHYMAPEIGNGSYGKGVDIYAMGIVLYEMLTGDVPFRGESSQEIIMKHLTADPDLDRVPADFREVIRRSLLKDPTLRFGTISELRQHLPWVTANANGSDRTNGQRVSFSPDKTAAHRLPNVLETTLLEEGIRFGPLVDSSAGVEPSKPIHFIGDPQAAFRETVVRPGNEEPIAQAVRGGWGRVIDWWNDNSVSTPMKVFVLLVAGLVITANSEWLLPVALGLGFVYLIYFAIRNLLLSLAPRRKAAGVVHVSRRQQREVIRAGMRRQLANQDFLTQASTLTGSMLLSAIICIALNVLGLAVSGSLFESPVESWALFAVSAIVSVAGSWLMLVVGKFYEPSDGEPLPRRFAMLVAGLVIGALAYAAGSYLHVDFDLLSDDKFNPLHASRLVFESGSTWMTSLLFFASVFGLLRWWRQVDPTRRTRLSVWRVGLCLIWAAVLGHMLNFAPFWSCLVVVVISIAIQLAAPWIPSSERQAYLYPKAV